MANVITIIPARWESSRFPGKPLAQIMGLPMIQHVYERAKKIPKTKETYVATDDKRIAEVVEGFGGQAIITSSAHRSGSDRLNEAASILNLNKNDIILNVQGDQPLFNPLLPGKLIEVLINHNNLQMSTVAIPFKNKEDVLNPNQVKVVFGKNQLALYFSRAPIPYPRDERATKYYRHIGLYAYRRDFLEKFTKYEHGLLENIESLEQLRALENKANIYVVLADGLSPEVDVPKDIIKVEEILKNKIEG